MVTIFKYCSIKYLGSSKHFTTSSICFFVKREFVCAFFKLGLPKYCSVFHLIKLVFLMTDKSLNEILSCYL